MNPLVKKEIRLLLPSWIVALSLAVVPMWLVKNMDNFGGWEFFFFLAWLGMIAPALESFGREFSPGVFLFFMSQPEERKRLWRVKVTTLAAATISVLIAFYISVDLRQLAALHLTSFRASKVDDAAFVNLQTFPALALTAFAGGLWSTLLLRQTVAAVWVVVLSPIAIGISWALLLPENSSLHNYDSLFTNVELIIYSVASYLFARWLFFRAQEVGWTGGTIIFPTWKYFDAGKKFSGKRKKRGAVAALFAKELQLHSISLFCAAALLALHIIAICLRPALSNSNKHPIGELVSSGFCILWLMMPVIIGGMAVAEERKLGVIESLLCLPTSRRLQFAIKFFMALFFGTLLGGVMPLVLEKTAAYFGAPNGIFDGLGDAPLQHIWFVIFVLIGTTVFTFVAFFASTLSKNFLHAVGVTVATALGCGLFFAFVEFVGEHNTTFFGITPWHSMLPILIAIPVIVATLFWLAWLNFKTIHEERRMWWRNIFWISSAVIFIVVSSTVIYNRAWEVFEPAELPHGAAIFSLSNPPKLESVKYDNFHVRLPDGRVWFDSLGYNYGDRPSQWKELQIKLLHPWPQSDGPEQFMDGSNWVSASAWHIDSWDEITPSKYTHIFGYFDTVGVHADGTLWISSKAVPEIWTGDKMIRFGGETNWKQVARSRPGFLLLKTDGTLWRWGDTNRVNSSQWHTNWPTVRADKPYQIGTNSDWKEILPVSWIGINYIRKADGSVWTVNFDDFKTEKEELKRQTNLDQVSFQTLSLSGNGEKVCVQSDGTLWLSWNFEQNGKEIYSNFVRVGTETNWANVVVTWNGMVALKSDGTLWKWDLPYGDSLFSLNSAASPTRLGIHNDWVALTGVLSGVVSLAADGSLWLWPDKTFYDAYYEYGYWLKLPKQPQFLGNVFAKPD
ncbi:MAG TPA: ABC transporter permease [Verrucomicrobiae bacterium]